MRFQDVILLAEDQFTRHPKRRISENTKQVIFEEDDSLFSNIVDDMRTRYPEFKIQVISAPVAPVLRGLYRLYDKGGKMVRIAISENLNNCWMRYVFAKEMCHALIDLSTPNYRSTDVEKQLDDLLFNGFSIAQDLSSESAAAFLASELMCPYHYNHILTSPVSSYEVASEFGMPERIVDVMRAPKYQVARCESITELNS